MLILRIQFNFSLNAIYKQGRFFKILSKKDLKFILSRRNSIIVFNLNFILLPAKIDLVTEKQICKKYMLGNRGSGHIKIILVLSTKIVAFYI